MIVAGVIVVMMWPSLRPVTPGTVRARRGRPAALAATARAGLDAALIALGVLAFWELRRYSAVPRLSGGTLGIDPVLAVAPVLALAGIALLPLRLLPAAARLLDRLSARGRRLAAALASWQVSRRAVREGSPVLLVILAVATGTLALAQHQSWRQSQLDQAALMAGADVRVSLPAPLPLDEGGALARGPRRAHRDAGRRLQQRVQRPGSRRQAGGGDGAAPAGPVQPAARPALAADHPRAPRDQAWSCPVIPPGSPSWPRCCRPAPPSPVATGPGGLGAGQVSLSVQDGSGTVYTVPAGTLPADGRDHDLAAVLDAAGGARYPLRLLGLTVSYQLPGFPAPPYPSAAARRAALRAEQRQRGRPRDAGRPWPGGLPADLRRLPGPVRRGGCPAPVARRGRPPRISPTRRRPGSRPPSPPGGPAGTRPR